MRENNISLFINTATKALQVGLKIKGENFVSRIENPKTALENTHVLIKELLEEHALTLKEVDSYYCLLGPGSNTGIRLGLTVPRTIYAFDPTINIYGIETLSLFLKGREGKTALLSDRNGNFYRAEIKDGEIVLSMVKKDQIDSLRGLDLVMEKSDKVGLSLLEGEKIEEIDTLVEMMKNPDAFEDFSKKEEEFLPRYLQQL